MNGIQEVVGSIPIGSTTKDKGLRGRLVSPFSFRSLESAASISVAVRHRIEALIEKQLCEPIEVVVQPDDSGFIATADGLPLYGYGDSVSTAFDMLRHEVETLHEELNSGAEYAPHWEEIRTRLTELSSAARMKNGLFDTRQVTRCCEQKLDVTFRQGSGRSPYDNGVGRHRWGRCTSRMTIPRGRKPVPAGTYSNTARQVHLTIGEFDSLLDCTMDGDAYRERTASKDLT